MIYRTGVGLDVHARSIAAAALDHLTGEVAQRSFALNAAPLRRAPLVRGPARGHEGPGGHPAGGEACQECRFQTIHPLTTALLSELYESQFEQEAKETLEATNDCPQFYGEEGYLREGIPFRRRALGSRRHLMSVHLWSIGDSGEDYYDCEGAPSGGIYTDEALGGTWTVRAWEEIDAGGRSEEELSSMDDEEYWSIVDEIEYFQLAREETVVRFIPWSGGEQSTLLKLSEKYGDRLVGLFKTPYSDLEVYVDEVAG